MRDGADAAPDLGDPDGGGRLDPCSPFSSSLPPPFGAANRCSEKTKPPDLVSVREHAGRPCAAAATRHRGRRDDRARLDDRRRDLRRAGARRRGGGFGPAHRIGGRGRRRLLQCDVVGAAGRAVSTVRRNVRVRPRAARRVLGLHRGLELRGRQDGLVRRHGADGRNLRLAGACARRRSGRGGGVDRGQLRRRPEVGAAHPRHRRDRACRARRGGGDRPRVRRRRRLPAGVR